MAQMFRKLIFLIGILFGVPQVWAQTTDSDARHVYEQAAQALANGDPDVAVRLSELLLQRNREDYHALFLLSLSRAHQRDHKAAATAAGRAFRTGTTDHQKLQAARIAGAEWFKSGRYSRAEWWLRRAANHAKTEESAAQVKQEFQAIRENNPFSLRLNISVSPSNNVNGGADEQFFDLGNIRLVFSPESLALSGIEYAGDLDLTYRLSQNSNQVTEVSFYAYGRTYTLSPEARAKAPRARGSDFSLSVIDLSFHHRRFLFDGLGPTGVSVHSGQVWYGGDPLWRYNRLSLWQTFPNGRNASTTVRISAEDQKSLGSFHPDTTVYDLQGTYIRQLPNRDVLQLSLATRYNDSVIITSTFLDYLASIDYVLAKPVFDTRLVFSLAAGYKSYDEFSLSLDGRRDRYLRARVTAVFEQISYFGFSPSFSVIAKRTNSNVTRFTKLELQGAIGFESKF